MNVPIDVEERVEDPKLLTIDRRFSEIYSELKRLAAYRLKMERPNHTLSPTAVVNELYLKLREQHSLPLDDVVKLKSLASEMIRRILVNYANERNRQKRGSGQTISIEDSDEIDGLQIPGTQIDILALNEGLERLARENAQSARIVELRYFGGLTQTEIAEELNLTRETVSRKWSFAKAWLQNYLENGGNRNV